MFPILDTKVYDEILPIANEAAFSNANDIAKTEGILVGISSGAALAAAIELAKREENAGKTIVALFPTQVSVTFQQAYLTANK